MGGWRAALLVGLLAPMLMGAKDSAWREVAEGDLAFIRVLSASGIRFDSEYREKLIDGRLAGCQPRPSRVRGMDPEEFERLRFYGERYCEPWFDAWARTFRACQDRVITPDWCDTDDEQVLMKHVPFLAYVQTLAAAIPGTEEPLVRGNIMELIADRMNSEALRDFPTKPLDQSIAGAVSAYLETATPEEAIRIAEPILGATFGHDRKVAAEFVAYRDRPGALTVDQRCALTAILMRKGQWTCGSLTGGYLRNDQEQRAAERRALEARALTPANIGFLMRRIDAYYGLEREGDCAGTYAFLALDLREGGHEKESWVRTCEHILEGIRTRDWRVDRILGRGNWVKVHLHEEEEYLKGGEKGRTASKEWELYWVFEDETWNYALGVTPEGWNDKDVVEIPVPPRGPQESPRVDPH